MEPFQFPTKIGTLSHPIRDKVLANAKLQPGQTLLDVGCGDGLIAFGALHQDSTVKVTFADISAQLLESSRALAEEARVRERCTFVQASADNLSGIQDASVDVVTTRSVLIYMDRKQQSFAEFHRVLKPGGRLSIFEPINRFGWPEARDRFWYYDATPVVELADKVKASYAKLQPLASDPMMNFDERDLVRLAESAGFDEVNLKLELRVGSPEEKMRDWNEVYLTAPNPKIPCLKDAVSQTLTEVEAEQFLSHLRSQVEINQARTKGALAYLWAVK